MDMSSDTNQADVVARLHTPRAVGFVAPVCVAWLSVASWHAALLLAVNHPHHVSRHRAHEACLASAIVSRLCRESMSDAGAARAPPVRSRGRPAGCVWRRGCRSWTRRRAPTATARGSKAHWVRRVHHARAVRRTTQARHSTEPEAGPRARDRGHRHEDTGHVSGGSRRATADTRERARRAASRPEPRAPRPSRERDPSVAVACAPRSGGSGTEGGAAQRTRTAQPQRGRGPRYMALEALERKAQQKRKRIGF